MPQRWCFEGILSEATFQMGIPAGFFINKIKKALCAGGNEPKGKKDTIKLPGVLWCRGKVKPVQQTKQREHGCSGSSANNMHGPMPGSEH
jgi:hypothetical protein